MLIEDHTFLVTGGASGLGAAAARLLAEAGGHVVIAVVNAETGTRTAGELGARVRFVKTDVSDEVSVQQAIDEAQSAFGGLHGVVNAAGIAIAEKVLGKGGPHSLES